MTADRLVWPAVWLALSIAVVDLIQVPWLGKGVGALGGAVLYGVLAWGFRRRQPAAFVVAAVMPVLPWSLILSGSALVPVDPTMVAVAVVQTLLALVSLGWIVAHWRAAAESR